MKKNSHAICITYCVTLIFLLCGGFSVFAQDGERNAGRQSSGTSSGVFFSISSDVSDEMGKNVMLARSSADYRVTPGDEYTLTYAVGNNTVTYIISVDSSYRIRVANLGIVNGAGKTFMQLKNDVEGVVSNNYPLSGVQLVLTQPAIFKVYVKGEVPAAGEVPAWGLSRLSSLIKQSAVITEGEDHNVLSDSLTRFASLRDVSVRSSNGQTRVYDLFKAQRLGDLSQDPYLRPGDEITFNRVKRSVTIDGEVERPGMYQLLDGENISELIEFYGNGFTPESDKTRLELIRLVNSVEISGDKIFLSENDLKNNFVLENYDKIIVPQITQLQPVMFVEGAVSAIMESNNSERTTFSLAQQEFSASNRLVVPFNKGDTYGSIVRKNIRWFTAVSDTQSAYILRNEEKIPLNLNPMLYDSSYRNEVFVQENDTLVVPFRQYFVTVAGSVVNPGRYPHIPDRDWEYYIALAGGFIMERNASKSVTITDLSGKRLKKTSAITPETVITANTNHALYYFNLYAPVIMTAFSLVTTFISVQMLLR